MRHEYSDGGMAIFHGPRKLAVYEATGKLVTQAAGRKWGMRRNSARGVW